VINVRFKANILDDKAIDRTVTRLAHEIIENNRGTDNLIIVGILTRGVPLSNRIAQKIFEIENISVLVSSIDISMYRDDLSKIGDNPVVGKHEINEIDIDNKKVILVDDVIYTGRTVRAAMDALMDIGRPKVIQLAVLVDRGHRELPIRPDYVGKNVPTSNDEIVKVRLNEVDKLDEVVIYKK
jgi:pyrimidine operon attenuation protein/uracil phosphoribosyltransferase